MLQTLSIRNVVLIDKLDLDFKSGLSVLTGETGAGKSILLDSLGLALGSRAETSLIRHGEDKLSVTATFTVEDENHPIFELFNEFELDKDVELTVKRTLSRDGKTKIFLNDQPISVKLLKEIGKFLVEVHGQFDNQGLLNPANHKAVLDNYGGYNYLVTEVGTRYKAYKKAEKDRLEAENNIAKAKSDEEALRHWVDELQKLNPQTGEEEQLTQRRLELMNSEKLIESLNFAYGSITQGADVCSALRQAQSAIAKANHLVDGKYDEIANTLEQALIFASESANQIEEASNHINMDAGELNNIEDRLFTLRGIARKHNVGVDELSETLEKFRTQLSTIELGEEGIASLKKAEEEAKQEFIKTAEELHKKRLEAAKNLDSKVMAELPPLKMEKAKFVTQVEKQNENSWNETGIDDVYFTVATNPNSPQGPINKIASGGELARFMLALKVNLAKTSNVPTLIFDEVDSGIGGATARAVGERLSRLAQDVQVLVVTHSPQVASKGDCHFKVEKNTKDNITTTIVEELNQEQREEEIARMLAGETISDEARAAAKVLIG